MRMPVMDGMQLLTKVREKWPSIVRIVLTGETSYDVAVRMVPIAHQYLLKPCSGEELVGVIERTQSVLARLENPNIRELVGGLSALPSIPETYRKLSEALDDPTTSPGQVARIIESEPPIALKLLQLANSAFFSRRVATNDVVGAIVQLGMNTIRHVVLQLAAFQLAANVKPGIQAHLRELQSRSMRIAACARDLVPASLQGAEAFMAGLLCDIGQVILATVKEARWAELLEGSKQTGQPIEVLEKQAFGVSHAEVGALLMGVWGLPHFAAESCAYHHDPTSISLTKLDITGAVCLANLLVDAKPDDDARQDTLGIRTIIDHYRAKLEKRGRTP
jgi:HD-like signal output (HDOD) protein